MTSSVSASRALAIVPILVCLLIPSLAAAGEVVVKNCSTQGVRFKVKAFNSTDVVRIVPSGSMNVPAGSAGRLQCATEECTILIEYPAAISRTSTLLSDAYASDLNQPTAKHTSNPNKRHFCVRYTYLDSGKVSSLSHLNTGASSCGCP